MVCLYTNGNSIEWEGYKFDRIIVDESEVDALLKKGYVLHPAKLEAKKATLNKKEKQDELDKKTVN